MLQQNEKQMTTDELWQRYSYHHNLFMAYNRDWIAGEKTPEIESLIDEHDRQLSRFWNEIESRLSEQTSKD